MAGRFLSVDPVVTNAKDGSFFGRYHYANNNPYRFIDPDGRASILARLPHEEGVATGGSGLRDVLPAKVAAQAESAIAAGSVAAAVGSGGGGRAVGGVLGAAAAKGIGTASKATSKIDRSAFAKESAAHWKEEANANPSKYGAVDLARMEKGKAPIGADGHPMELHHKDRTMEGGLQPMTRTEHRLGENYKKNHPD